MNNIRLYGIADGAARFLEKEQLSDSGLWAEFVNEFRTQIDGENHGWRGEYWGKMMRGGALVYAYTKSEELYNILTETVVDMMSVAESDGRVSSYSRETEFDYWDIWCRKYVILGMEYYMEICKDEQLKKQILAFICGAADYIINRIGKDKIEITKASKSWRGVNSSSILEPIVKLYNLTKEQKYLDFASYIVETGGAEGINIFELAYDNQLYPYQYGVSKAYEMISCFEGLLEYYYVTGVEKHKTAVINFAKAVLSSECSIIGSCGVTHELFDHTKNRQTVAYDGVMQETCVTVTWMKFCSRIWLLTKDPMFIDAMEVSFYNAYMGTFNTEHRNSNYIHRKFIEMMGLESVRYTYLPFDSYSPLTPGVRGRAVGGCQLLSSNGYYGCCACIGAAGVGVFISTAVCVEKDVVTVNFYEKGSVDFSVKGVGVSLEINTEYPVSGNVQVNIKTEKPIAFTIKVRVPSFVSGEGYREFKKEWYNNKIELSFPMEVVYHYPEKWESDVIYTDTSKNAAGTHIALPKKVYHMESEDKYVALTRGPLTLAVDSRLGKMADSVFSFGENENGKVVLGNECKGTEKCVLKMSFTDKNGEEFYLVDYASAGRDWKTLISAWLPTE